MKAVFNLTLMIAVIVAAGIGCLVIVDVLTFDQGKDYAFKALAVIALLGGASAIISLFAGNKKSSGD